MNWLTGGETLMMFTPQLEMQPLAPGAAVPTGSIKISHG
jgi:hypothetical protein